MSRKVALIIGITGQDGSYLAELLLNEGYEVHGIKRRASSYNQARIDGVILAHPRSECFQLHYGDVLDFAGICSILNEIRPTELYNLAAQSHVKVSFDVPLYTAQVDALGALNILEAVRSVGLSHQVRLYQASTSELYGKVLQIPQSEHTPFYPRSPYAVSKLMAFWAFVNYREAYGMYACNGILFNHESPRRGETFVTRKITMAVAKIAKGRQKFVLLGNLDAKRDWGHAKDYVWCMWKMLQMDSPSDYVVATGQTTSVRMFCELAFSVVGITVVWEGRGPTEVGRNKATKDIIVKVDGRYFRPTEVDILVGDPSKAKRELGWDPQRTDLSALVREMVLADLEALE